ncbi:MAG: ATP-binding cassette domain-containing protein [Treponema sp.]|nr:ATP-binding cassette domain-containing protein [Treponema sp.]
MSIIKVQDLHKTFKVSKRPKGLPGTIANLFVPKFQEKIAVDGISFEIQKGEAVGFIGANGAGKSTTIKMMSGILYPTEGSVEVMGFNPQKDRKQYVSHIGVVFGQKSQLSWDLPVIDSFELLKHIYRIPEEKYLENVKIFTELLDMESFIEQPVRQLSLGQRMRADIAAALLHSPDLVFFDEPTIGLDVLAKEKIRKFVRYMNKEKQVTMIFTTHDMKDIEETCDRMILIDKGKLLYDGNVSQMVSNYGKERKLIVEFETEVEINPIQDVLIFDEGHHKKSFTFNCDKIAIKDLLNELSSKYPIVDFTVREMEIETVVRKIYEGEIKL